MQKTTKAALAAVLAAAALAGCQPDNQAPQNEAAEAEEGPVTFPLKERITLTYWSALPANVASTVSSFKDTEFFKELERRTNIKIEFIHPPVGQEKEALNLMLAGKELPDIIESGFENYSGGFVRAKEEGFIIPLNDSLPKYAPNLSQLMADNPDIAREVKTPEGDILYFPYIRNDVESLVSTGPIMRKDWLDELGLPAPSTIDEWHAALTAFKEKKGVKAPLTLIPAHLGNGSPFVGSFGIGSRYYLDRNQVKFGPAEAGYKDFLALFRKWFQEGLLDSEFAVNNVKTFESKILNGETGAFIAANGGLERYLKQGQSKTPAFDLVGVPYPSRTPDEPVRFMFKANPIGKGKVVTITTANKHVREAMAWVDYGYGQEGSLLNSYGIEGVTYTMENGAAKFTDLITRNPEGLSMTNALLLHARGNNGGSYMLDGQFFGQYWPLSQQQKANKAWSKWLQEDKANPSEVKGTLTAEESARIASKETEINTYVDEMFIKFVLGQEPIDNFDKFVAQIGRMGLSDILQTKQAMHDRYMNTK